MLGACVATILLAAQLPAQPDFSGRWVLIAPAPADVPAVLVVQQQVRRTDVRGNPMEPYWDLLSVEGDPAKRGIRSGIYHISMGGGVVPGIPPSSPPTPETRWSVLWQGDKLVIATEAWIEREGKRESYERHQEVWALGEQGRLEITVTDGNAVRTVAYQKGPSSR